MVVWSYLEVIDQARGAEFCGGENHQGLLGRKIPSSRWLQIDAFTDGEIIRLPAALCQLINRAFFKQRHIQITAPNCISYSV